MPPEITSIEVVPYRATDSSPGPDRVAVRIETDIGVSGEYDAYNAFGLGQVLDVAPSMVGMNPLNRERHWSELRRALRKYDMLGVSMIDIALWDFAGKFYDAPIHQLLGTYRTRLPAYYSAGATEEDRN